MSWKKKDSKIKKKNNKQKQRNKQKTLQGWRKDLKLIMLQGNGNPFMEKRHITYIPYTLRC